MSHYIYVIAIMFRYALWLSITNHYLNLYHFRSQGHFGPSSCCTICSGVKLSSSTSAEICEWKKMLQKVHQNWTTAQKHWYLKHLQFMRWFISLLGAKHFERRKCDTLTFYQKQTRKPSVPRFPKCGTKKLWRIDVDLPSSPQGLPTMFTWTLEAQVDGVSQRNPGRVPGHVGNVKQLPRAFASCYICPGLQVRLKKDSSPCVLKSYKKLHQDEIKTSWTQQTVIECSNSIRWI